MASLTGFALSGALSMVTVILPAGLGAREGLLTLILASAMPVVGGDRRRLVSRFVVTLVDVLAAAAGWAYARRHHLVASREEREHATGGTGARGAVRPRGCGRPGLRLRRPRLRRVAPRELRHEALDRLARQVAAELAVPGLGRHLAGRVGGRGPVAQRVLLAARERAVGLVPRGHDELPLRRRELVRRGRPAPGAARCGPPPRSGGTRAPCSRARGCAQGLDGAGRRRSSRTGGRRGPAGRSANRWWAGWWSTAPSSRQCGSSRGRRGRSCRSRRPW